MVLNYKYNYVVLQNGEADHWYPTRNKALSRFIKQAEKGGKLMAVMERRKDGKWYKIAQRK